MNKILTTALVLGALYGTANAKIYLGVDGGYTTIDMKKFEIDGVSKENSFSIGLNAGIDYTINDKFFVGAEAHVRGGELFNKNRYDFTDNFGKDRYYETSITNPYGAKIFAGTIINKKIELFASAGIEIIYYEENYSKEYSYSDPHGYHYTVFDIEELKTSVSPSFGLGISYKISNNFDLKLSYEHILSEYEVENPSSYIKTPINTIRLGVNYLF